MGEKQTMGQRLAASWADPRQRGAEGRSARIEVDYRALVSSVTTTETDGAAGMLGGQGELVVGQPTSQRVYVGDVVTGQPPDPKGGGKTSYVVEYSPASDETGATGVAEGLAKAEQVLEWTSDELKLVKIAAWTPATEEVMADAGQLDLLIRTTLNHRLRFREEVEIINGVDTDSSLLGILATPAIATSSVNGSAAGTRAALEAAEESIMGAGEMTVVCSPGRYWDALAEVPGFWRDLGEAGVRVIRTRAIADGKVIAGPLGSGAAKRATAVTIRTSDSHSDFFLKNELAVVAEVRESFRVTSPDAFAVNSGTL